MSDYRAFLDTKAQWGQDAGFDPVWLPEFLFDFQRALVEWAIRKGRAAIFADCGLGKTPMQLVWAENIVRRENRPVLIVTPLAVSYQVLAEAEKFGVDCRRVTDGTVPSGSRLLVTNYERLHLFSPKDVAGVVCDESSILKNFDGVRRGIVTEFLRTLPYRLLCTATAAPNDYVELGTSSEALGVMGHMDMLTRFFRNVDGGVVGSAHAFRFKHAEKLEAFRGKASFWRFKHHAEQQFWRWVCSWARAVRRPSDLGFDDAAFVLPEMTVVDHTVKARAQRDGWLFDLPAIGMQEEREERRRTVTERCELVAGLVNHDAPAFVACHLNEEASALVRMIPDAEQVSGSDDDDDKEAKLLAFARGDLRVLVTKPKIGAWGLNLQHCAHVTYFPSHSYEQYYQWIRRCWRFGQTRPVRVDRIATEGEAAVLGNLSRKAAAADAMFTSLVAHMNQSISIDSGVRLTAATEVPAWL